ncbi:hypothetical protein M9H77_08607 [Catharanthus roseus]|uniref:Uncharacterized protein n=1 Tax=Catharanthus roseus TaxID=4058 RepID=A0ACC0BYG8_CATRO|nr:hypothetical protein M9H77_08607 [Catharanthus roseus]
MANEYHKASYFKLYACNILNLNNNEELVMFSSKQSIRKNGLPSCIIDRAINGADLTRTRTGLYPFIVGSTDKVRILKRGHQNKSWHPVSQYQPELQSILYERSIFQLHTSIHQQAISRLHKTLQSQPQTEKITGAHPLSHSYDSPHKKIRNDRIRTTQKHCFQRWCDRGPRKSPEESNRCGKPW